MKLLADRMLGTLAKWLRLLGFDTAFPEECEDSLLLTIAAEEDRVILTRDKGLAARTRSGGIRCLLLGSVGLEEQLEEVFGSLHLEVEKPLSRCALCNSELDAIEKTIARNGLPEAVAMAHERFWYCSQCSKLYWEGSHWENMSRFIEEMGICWI